MKSLNTINQSNPSWLTIMKKNWLILAIIILAALLRSWQLNSHAILFGDAGRDLLQAKLAITNVNIPLLGIPSSIPRFHQGPVTIWLEMMLYLIFEQNTLAFSVFFVFLGILTIILVYEFSMLNIDKSSSLITATLLAFSPMAIAHSRMIYHTTPIPLLTICYLFSLIMLWKQQKHSLLISSLSFAVLMQFELSLLPLGLMIPYIIYRKKISINKISIMKMFQGLIIGFLPQIIHDFISPLKENQLGGFIAWTGYKTISGLIALLKPTTNANRIIGTLTIYWSYWEKMYGLNNSILAISILFFLICALILVWINKKNNKPGLEIASVATIILAGSYIIHGQPSEAYFPPFFVLFSLLIGWGASKIFHWNKYLLIIFLIGWSTTNIFQVFKANFFVSTTNEYNYGPSMGEQRAIIKIVDQISKGKFTFATTLEEGKFNSYFDNLYWLAQKQGFNEPQSNQVTFYIEAKNSPLDGYPGLTKIEFESRDVYFK